MREISNKCTINWPAKKKKETTKIMDGYQQKVYKNVTTLESLQGKEMTELERIGLKMDDLLLDNDYIFPVEDEPVALSDKIVYKGHSIWIKIHFPMIRALKIENGQYRTLKTLYIGHNYRKSCKEKGKGSESDFEYELSSMEAEEPDDEVPNIEYIFEYLFHHFRKKFEEFDLPSSKPTIEYFQKALNPDWNLKRKEKEFYRRRFVSKEKVLDETEGSTYCIEIHKPLLEINNVKNNYSIFSHPEIGPIQKPGDHIATIDSVFNWIFGDEQYWMIKTLEYFKTFSQFERILDETGVLEELEHFFIEREYSSDITSEDEEDIVSVSNSDGEAEAELEVRIEQEQKLELQPDDEENKEQIDAEKTNGQEEKKTHLAEEENEHKEAQPKENGIQQDEAEVKDETTKEKKTKEHTDIQQEDLVNKK
ncbi:unnamed protein product [Moneuplotes crassus]|uniref:Uncharacterized protein n=1 Tax=Euplotes crassus TaxID=5936 RepID=A0AAD1UJ43_EUPCR|nr:unnamed protein product [Moneuplotes crassus]